MELEAIDRADAEAVVCVDATAPVRARTTTKTRTMFCMMLLLFETPGNWLQIVVDFSAATNIE